MKQFPSTTKVVGDRSSASLSTWQSVAEFIAEFSPYAFWAQPTGATLPDISGNGRNASILGTTYIETGSGLNSSFDSYLRTDALTSRIRWTGNPPRIGTTHIATVYKLSNGEASNGAIMNGLGATVDMRHNVGVNFIFRTRTAELNTLSTSMAVPITGTWMLIAMRVTAGGTEINGSYVYANAIQVTSGGVTGVSGQTDASLTALDLLNNSGASQTWDGYLANYVIVPSVMSDADLIRFANFVGV